MHRWDGETVLEVERAHETLAAALGRVAALKGQPWVSR